MRNKTNLQKKLLALMTMSLTAGFASYAHSANRQTTLVESDSVTVHSYTSAIKHSTNETHTIRKTKNRNPENKSSLYGLLWIFEAAIGFNTDHDHDGHYSKFTLSLDIDTSVATSAIYTVLYLSLEGGPWTEYAVSSEFSIHGTGPHDTYTIEADLDIGYPSGYYDQLIEVYDAYSHELLTSYGPNDSHSLQALPIESRHHDQLYSWNSDVSFNFSGTGSLGLPLLLPLVSIIALRRSSLRNTLRKRSAA